MSAYSTYDQARHEAGELARRLNHAVGVERASEYGRTVYLVKLIPNDPSQRFGWEMRCEPVLPTDPQWCKGE